MINSSPCGLTLEGEIKRGGGNSFLEIKGWVQTVFYFIYPFLSSNVSVSSAGIAAYLTHIWSDDGSRGAIINYYLHCYVGAKLIINTHILGGEAVRAAELLLKDPSLWILALKLAGDSKHNVNLKLYVSVCEPCDALVMIPMIFFNFLTSLLPKKNAIVQRTKKIRWYD